MLLWLEHLGLDQQRDQISMQVLGDQPIMMQAVETGIADAAALDGVFSKHLRLKGFTVLGESANLAQRTVGQAMVVPQSFLSQRPNVVENYLKAEIEALAFSVAPKNKPTVIKNYYEKAQSRPPTTPRKAIKTC